jgi:hypothetical protein
VFEAVPKTRVAPGSGATTGNDVKLVSSTPSGDTQVSLAPPKDDTNLEASFSDPILDDCLEGDLEDLLFKEPANTYRLPMHNLFCFW